jgi:hypothetical protein
MTNKVFTPERFTIMSVRIMAALHGIVHTPNYWDYASCFEDLPFFLDAAIKCTYNPLIVPTSLNKNTSKNVPFSNVYKDWLSRSTTPQRNRIRDNMNIKTPGIPAKFHGIKGDPPIMTFKQFKNRLAYLFDDNYLGLYYNHDYYLEALDVTTSNDVYNTIIKNPPFDQILTNLVLFDLNKYKNFPFLVYNLNPFDCTNEEIIKSDPMKPDDFINYVKNINKIDINRLGVFISNSKYLKYLSIEESNRLYTIMADDGKLSWLLANLVNFDLHENGEYPFEKNNFNPFTVTETDINMRKAMDAIKPLQRRSRRSNIFT